MAAIVRTALANLRSRRWSSARRPHRRGGGGDPRARGDLRQVQTSPSTVTRATHARRRAGPRARRRVRPVGAAPRARRAADGPFAIAACGPQRPRLGLAEAGHEPPRRPPAAERRPLASGAPGEVVLERTFARHPRFRLGQPAVPLPRPRRRRADRRRAAVAAGRRPRVGRASARRPSPPTARPSVASSLRLDDPAASGAFVETWPAHAPAALRLRLARRSPGATDRT